MPKQQTIKFKIRQDGTVIEEVIDAASNQCLDLTESIEKKLGDVNWCEELRLFPALHTNLHLHQSSMPI